MPHARLAFLGYGSVNRALHALLDARRDALATEFGLTYEIVGTATRRTGWRAGNASYDDVHAWLDAAMPDVVLEGIALDPERGQPAADYLRAALEHGAHAISANKGPVVHAYRELTRLARDVGRSYRFEAAVMDGAPVFSLARECLPLAGLRSVHGVFTSTATIVLEAIEHGGTLADGIAHAQALGIAEADPSYDVDGWDAAVKLCAVANVLLGGDLRPNEVDRTGIGALTETEVREAHVAGMPIRLVGGVGRDASGRIVARVAPERRPLGDPLAVQGTTLVTHFDAEVFPGGLTVTSRDPDPTTTAYGMFADFVSVMRSSDHSA